ncbi:MAG: hypothetical protein VX865_01050 [Candidatus Thermoplasmatota archaeon]|nr:hypothetical protein [Candidatus Thermoplasmatota archaeon]
MESRLPYDTTRGLVLVACSILLLPISLDLMQDLDDAEKEYERECDLVYRAISGNDSAPDSDRCSELNEARSRSVLVFMASLGAFLLTGLVGLATVLPSDEGQG